MSEAEMKLNADLIRKTGVVQIWDVHIMIYYFDFLFVFCFVLFCFLRSLWTCVFFVILAKRKFAETVFVVFVDGVCVWKSKIFT
jgi:hypothetical protein